jgi:hypothetical protein
MKIIKSVILYSVVSLIFPVASALAAGPTKLPPPMIAAGPTKLPPPMIAAGPTKLPPPMIAAGPTKLPPPVMAQITALV